MKTRICPYRKVCRDGGTCETCDFGKAFIKLSNKIKQLKSKNEMLQAVNQELKDRLETLTNPNF